MGREVGLVGGGVSLHPGTGVATLAPGGSRRARARAFFLRQFSHAQRRRPASRDGVAEAVDGQRANRTRLGSPDGLVEGAAAYRTPENGSSCARRPPVIPRQRATAAAATRARARVRWSSM